MIVPSLKKLCDFLTGLRSRLLSCKLSKSEKPTVTVDVYRTKNGKFVITQSLTIVTDDLSGFEELADDVTDETRRKKG